MRGRPDEAGAARAEEPLVAARGETSTPRSSGRRVLDAEAVDAVDAEQDALELGSAVVGVGDRVRDLPQRQLDAARRVHPRDGDRAGFRVFPPAIADTIASAEAVSGSRVEGDPPHFTPSSAARSRSDSWVA